VSWVSDVPRRLRPSRPGQGEVALSALKASCGMAVASRHSLLDRLQGGRMVVQGGVELWCDGVGRSGDTVAERTTIYTVSAAVDGLHGVSMLALAAVPGWRRHAGASAALALLFAAADLMVARAARPPVGAHRGADR